MTEPLLVVEAAFELAGRGTVLAPYVSPKLLPGRLPVTLDVELARPDGTREQACAMAAWSFVHPRGGGIVLALAGVPAAGLPTGTVIWAR